MLLDRGAEDRPQSSEGLSGEEIDWERPAWDGNLIVNSLYK